MDLDVWELYECAKRECSVESESTDDPMYCSSCKTSGKLHEDHQNGIIVCTNCGVIKESDIIDTRPEWQFNMEDASFKKDPSRCGVPINPLLEKSSTSTMIVSNKNFFMKKLHNQMSMDYVERSRYHVFEKINKYAGDIGHLTPNIIEQAKYYYKILSERKLSRGNIRCGLIACCIIHACKYYNVSRSLQEISKMTDVSISILNKTNKDFIKIMSDILTETYSTHTETYFFQATDSVDLIPRYCNQLGLNKKDEIKLIKECNKLDTLLKKHCVLDCKTPSGISTGIMIYVNQYLELPFTKNDVSKMFNISIVTINKIVNIINEFLTKYKEFDSL
jgi:transcription initiation factor TFIIB